MGIDSSNSLITKAAGKKTQRPKGSGSPRIGIELDSVCAKAVELRIKSNGDLVIDHLAVTELSYFTYDEVPLLLRNFMRDYGFKKRKIVSCFPRNLCTIRFMQLPSVNHREIQEMVGFQAIKQIPYNREDMIVDHEIVSKSETGYSDVLLAIVHKNVIYQHIDAIEGAGYLTTRIDINSQAALRTYLYFKNRDTLQAATGSNRQDSSVSQVKPVYVAFINIDYTQTNIQITGSDRLVFTRGIMHGIMHLILKEKKFQAESANINWQSELMDELRRSFAVFSREQQGAFIEKIVLAGGVSNFHNIERNISTRFQVPVEVFNLRDHIAGLEKFEDKLTIQGKEISPLAPIGMLLQDPYHQLDMIPDYIKRQRRNKRRMASLAVASLIMAGLLTVGAVNFYAEVNLKSQEIALLQSKLDALSPRVKKLEQMRTKINLIRDHVGTTRMSLDFLRELYLIIPEDIALAGFLYDETKYIIIKGTAETMSNVFDLIPKIEESNFFEKVSSRGVKRRKVGQKEVVDFEIQCSLIKEEDAQAQTARKPAGDQTDAQAVRQPEQQVKPVKPPEPAQTVPADVQDIQQQKIDAIIQDEQDPAKKAILLQTDQQQELLPEEVKRMKAEQLKAIEEEEFRRFQGSALPAEQQELLRERLRQKYMQQGVDEPPDPYSGFKQLPGIPEAVRQRKIPRQEKAE